MFIDVVRGDAQDNPRTAPLQGTQQEEAVQKCGVGLDVQGRWGHAWLDGEGVWMSVIDCR